MLAALREVAFKTILLLLVLSVTLRAARAQTTASSPSTRIENTVPPPALIQASFYRVEQEAGVWWLRAPDGAHLFSLGVDCVGVGATRKNYDPVKPEYAAFRHYATDAAWGQATLIRLEKWKFNTLGAWCDIDTLRAVPKVTLPYAQVLYLGSSVHAPWCDLFNPAMPKQFDELARTQTAAWRDDPRTLGWFVDNELGWWDDTIWLYFLQQPKTNTTRQRLLTLLRTGYQNDFARLQSDFYTGDAHSWNDLERKATLTLRPGGRGIAAVHKFVYALAERYYQLCYNAVRHWDKNHLLLGSRYAGYCPIEVARASRPYLDVASTNYGADWNNGDNAHFFLEMLHQVTGKPVMVTEFYFCANENRSGNRNSSAGFPTVQTQRERAAGFQRNLSQFAALPYVIGAHWFQYYDEPSAGRGDGENYNMGLVDIVDRPYEELTETSAALNLDALHRIGEQSQSTPKAKPTQGASFVPPVAPDSPLELSRWDKQRAWLPSSSTEPFADLYVCHDRTKLYVAVFAAEYADDKLYRGGKMPPEERMVTTIKMGSDKPVRVRFGLGGKVEANRTTLALREWKAATRYAMLVALPLPSGVSQQAKSLVVTLQSHSRGHTMNWKRVLELKSPQ